MEFTTRLIKGIVAILAIAVIGYFAGTLSDRFDDPAPVVISHGEADIGGPFELVDTKGRPFSEQNLLGRHSLIYFGYTNCPDVCPLDMNRISMALSQLETEIGLGENLLPVFITVDPKRDTPERIAEFLKGYHAAFIGLTGTQAQMETAARAYKVYWEEILEREHPAAAEHMTGGMGGEMDGDMAPVLINHSSFIFLMDKNGKYVRHYDSSIPASQLAADLLDRLD